MRAASEGTKARVTRDTCPGCGLLKAVDAHGRFEAHDKPNADGINCQGSGLRRGAKLALPEGYRNAEVPPVDDGPPPSEDASGGEDVPPPEEEIPLAEVNEPEAAAVAGPDEPEGPVRPLLLTGDPEPLHEPRAAKKPRQRNLAGETIAPFVSVERKVSERLTFEAMNFKLSVGVEDLEELQALGPGDRGARLDLQRRVRAVKEAVDLSPEAYARESAQLLDRAFNEAL